MSFDNSTRGGQPPQSIRSMSMKRKETSTIYFMSYNKHRIFFDTECKVYMVAIKRDGTDSFFITLDDAMDAIDEVQR